ncbi:MAG: DNA-directed RNA polymerase subunit G [Desulfurococcales archaeon]|nr:DNA-directed RNA polymerase subunit G [Desulfurococcales archaeon]
MVALEIKGKVMGSEPGKIPATTIYEINLENGALKMDLPDTLVRLNPEQEIKVIFTKDMDKELVDKAVFCAKTRLVEKSGENKVIVSVAGFVWVIENNDVAEYMTDKEEVYACII